MDTPYPDFERLELTFLGDTREVYRAGAGPAVIVMHEVPGLYPGVVDFGRKLIAAGFTVWMPSLIGQPGREPGAAYVAGSLLRACVAREFAVFAASKNSPMTSWLRALARHAHADCGGPGVGAIGMCLTGGFALAMMLEPAVVAPVLSQPSLPFPISAAHRRDLGIDEATLDCVRRRAAEGTPVMGLRFSHDLMVPRERFQRLRDELGDRFLAVEIDSSPGNPHGNPRFAHSVLVRHMIDAPGSPTRAALDGVIAFCQKQLGVS